MDPVCVRCDVTMIECPIEVETFSPGGASSFFHIISPSGKSVVPFSLVCPCCGHVELFVKIKNKNK